eukprot:9626568-Karenia_brevis.AAC.1
MHNVGPAGRLGSNRHTRPKAAAISACGAATARNWSRHGQLHLFEGESKRASGTGESWIQIMGLTSTAWTAYAADNTIS